MKINKKFIKLLLNKRQATVGEIVEELDLFDIKDGVIMNLNLNYTTLEEIFYTVDLLLKEELVESYLERVVKTLSFDISGFKNDKNLFGHFEFIQKHINVYWNKRLEITSEFYDYIERGYKTEGQRQNRLTILLPIIIALLGIFGAIFTQIFFDKYIIARNVSKANQVLNAEIYEYLGILKEYTSAKNQIVSDANFDSFIQDYRFNIEPLKDLLANNFQNISEHDLYRLIIVRNRLASFNKRLDILEGSKLKGPRLSKKPECNFMFFTPDTKEQAHRFLNDDLNVLVNNIKKLSFFQGNPYEELKPIFDLTDTQVGIFYFEYNKDYKKVDFNCE